MNCAGAVTAAGHALLHDWFLREPQITVTDAAARLNIARSTVRRALESPEPPAHGRAPPKMSAKHTRAMKKRQLLVVRLAAEDVTKLIQSGSTARSRTIEIVLRRYPSSESIAVEIQRLTGVRWSQSTIRSDLATRGWKARVKPSGPIRYVNDAPQRVNAFKKMLQRMDLVKKLVFSDECVPDTNYHGQRTQWVAPHEFPTMRHQDNWTATIHVWGAIGHDYKSNLVIFDESVNAAVYQAQAIGPNVAGLTARGRILMEDNARVHTCATTQQYHAAHHIVTLRDAFGFDWPARSPDANPIECLWELLKRRVYTRHMPMTKLQLAHAWAVEWLALTMKEVNSFVASFAKRARKIVMAAGKTISGTK